VGVGISVEHLNAWYGQTHTLQDINVELPANHATALIGPSGCGKSTFVRCLNRMHETNPIARAEGVVKMGDIDIYKDAEPVQIRRRVGMVFQRPNPFPTMSIYDNVASGLKLNGFRNRKVLDETVERSLKAAALHSYTTAFLWSSVIFVAGAVVAGLVLRRGDLGQLLEPPTEVPEDESVLVHS